MGLALGAAVLLVAVGLAAGRSRKPVRMAFSAALTGMGALGAVNLLAPLTGVSLALNWATSFMAVAAITLEPKSMPFMPMLMPAQEVICQLWPGAARLQVAVITWTQGTMCCTSPTSVEP